MRLHKRERESNVTSTQGLPSGPLPSVGQTENSLTASERALEEQAGTQEASAVLRQVFERDSKPAALASGLLL